MGKIRIYSLARELKLDNNEVLEAARSLGADVSTASSAIDDAIAGKIRAQKTDQKGRQRAQPGQPGQPREPRQQRGQRGQQGQHRGQAARETTPADSPPQVLEPETAVADTTPAKAVTGAQPGRRSSHSAKAAALAPEAAPEAVAAPVTAGRHPKRYYLVDGLNVCNWQKTPSLAPLVTLLIELKRQGHSFLCIFDANTRFVLEDLGERDKYEHLLNKFDCFGEVPGGTQADDFLLFRAHKTGDAIISNDQYRDQKYRERYKWLRSVSPRLCKGIVLGGFLILPELDVHARVRDSLASIIKEFEEVFGSAAHRERPEPRHEIKSPQRSEPRSEQKPAEARQKAEPKRDEKPAARSVEVVSPPEAAAAQPSAQPLAQVDGVEQRPRSRRGRRRRGRRGGGGGGAAASPASGGGTEGGAP